MRVFQNNGLSWGFRAPRFDQPYQSFAAGRAQFLNIRFAASHILLPVLSESPDAFYANGAVDMAGADRGNMRCFEAAGCGAVLLTDSGRYPEGFVDGETMVTYSSANQIPEIMERLVADVSRTNSIAQAGCAMVRDRYSKERQWAKFRELA